MSMKQIVFSVLISFAAAAAAQAPAKPEPMKEPAKEPAKAEAAPPKQATATGPKIPKQRRWSEDARHCLERGSNIEIIKCAEEFL
jgi:hypothetical protein